MASVSFSKPSSFLALLCCSLYLLEASSLVPSPTRVGNVQQRVPPSFVSVSNNEENYEQILNEEDKDGDDEETVVRPNSNADTGVVVQGDLCLIQDDDCESPFLFDDADADPVVVVDGGGDPRGTAESLLTARTKTVDDTLRLVPFVAPVLAFFTYDDVERVVRFVLEEVLSDNNWVAVDGGVYQSRIITPAINGVVLPSASILFATLIGNTVTTLRQRQLDVRTCLNAEAADLRALQSLVDRLDRTSRNGARAYLVQYVGRIVSESRPGVSVGRLGSLASDETTALRESLLDAAGAGASTTTTALLVSEACGALGRLNGRRAERTAALQSLFPSLHFAILAALGGSICLTFLMETDQEVLLFMVETPLRILWTILIGTMTSLAVVCHDLSDPFRGSYQILSSLDQFFTIRDALRASIESDKYDDDDDRGRDSNRTL